MKIKSVIRVISTIAIILAFSSVNAQDNFLSHKYLITKGKNIDTICEVHLCILSDKVFSITVIRTSHNDSITLTDFEKKPIEFVIKKSMDSITDSEFEKIYRDFKDFFYSPKIEITGNGLSNFTSSESKAFSTGATAGFGLSISQKSGYQFSIIGTVTETRDTINSQNTRDFGTSILVPGVRKFSVMANFRNLYGLGNRWGWGAFVNTTPLIWQTNIKKLNTPVDSLTITKTVVPFTFEGYFSYTPINTHSVKNPVRVTLDMGITLKTLGGDQLSNSERRYFTGSSQDFYAGLLFGVDLRFAGSHAYFYTTYIPSLGKNSANINGLTGVQLIGGIGLAATIADLSKK